MGLNWWVFLCGSNNLWNNEYAWTNKKRLFSAVLFKDKCFAVLFFPTLAKLVDNVTGPLFKVQRSTFKPVLVSEELKLFNRANIWRRKKHFMNCGNKWKNLILPRKQQCRLKAYYVKILLFVTMVFWQFSAVAFFEGYTMNNRENLICIEIYRVIFLLTHTARYRNEKCQRAKPELLFLNFFI